MLACISSENEREQAVKVEAGPYVLANPLHTMTARFRDKLRVKSGDVCHLHSPPSKKQDMLTVTRVC